MSSFMANELRRQAEEMRKISARLRNEEGENKGDTTQSKPDPLRNTDIRIDKDFDPCSEL